MSFNSENWPTLAKLIKGPLLEITLTRQAPLSDLGALKAQLWEMTKGEFKEEHYSRGKDVRSVPNWPSEGSILALIGESGQGKTWQLCGLAHSILAAGGSAVIVSATGDADKDLQRASDAVWLDGLNHDEPLMISRLASRYEKVLKRPAEDWLTVCVDDVHELKEARQLVKQPWKRWGIRLALTVPSVVGEALAADQPEGVHVLKVPDFTPTETRDCIERHGYDWGEIPDDVRTTLRRPILAELYCGVAGADSWHPHNEYEIYAKFWQRVTNKRDQPHHPSDRSILFRLAGSIIKADARYRYPWPQDFWQDAGLSDEALHRLESVGWLRRARRGDVEIWHDRLLNWAVAEWLIDQRRAERIDQPELTKRLCCMYQNQPKFAGKRLGHVPMDYLWLACDPENGVQQDVSILLYALEEHSPYGGNPEDFYTVLVPTLGKRVYPALRERLKASVSQDAATLEFYLAALEEELAEHHDEVITGSSPWLCRCLKLIANIHRPDLLRVIEAKANTTLERQISEIAQSRLPQIGFTMDPVFEVARIILCKIGGEELTELINSELGQWGGYPT